MSGMLFVTSLDILIVPMHSSTFFPKIFHVVTVGCCLRYCSVTAKALEVYILSDHFTMKPWRPIS